jgi:hypothetical protein
VLGAPVKKRVQLTTQLLNQLTRYFGVFHQGLRVQEIQARINLESITRYGRFRMTGDGDNIRTAVLIDSDPIARDNSYVKVRTLFIHIPFSAYVHPRPSTIFYQMLIQPTETDLMSHTGKLNMAAY